MERCLQAMRETWKKGIFFFLFFFEEMSTFLKLIFVFSLSLFNDLFTSACIQIKMTKQKSPYSTYTSNENQCKQITMTTEITSRINDLHNICRTHCNRCWISYSVIFVVRLLCWVFTFRIMAWGVIRLFFVPRIFAGSSLISLWMMIQQYAAYI